MIPEKIDRLLLRTQKPARYCGGEPGSVIKEKDQVDLRIAFCFPDLYEVGMSHLGMKILYGLLNNEEGTLVRAGVRAGCGFPAADGGKRRQAVWLGEL